MKEAISNDQTLTKESNAKDKPKEEVKATIDAPKEKAEKPKEEESKEIKEQVNTTPVQ